MFQLKAEQMVEVTLTTIAVLLEIPSPGVVLHPM